MSKAVHYATAAGDRAMDHLAPDDALRWYRQALDLVDRTPSVKPRERVEILIGLGDAERQCGLPDHRETLLEAGRLAVTIDAVDLLVRATLANSRGCQSEIGEVDTERIAMIDRSLERLADADGPDRARLLTLSCVERHHDEGLDERLRLAQQAVAVARRSGDLATLAYALVRPCRSITAPATLPLRVEWLTEGCRLADELGDLALRYSAHEIQMTCALEQGDLEKIRSHAAVLDRILERLPDATVHWITTYDRAWQMVLKGDLAEAERLAEAALHMGLETGQADALSIYGTQMSNIRKCQGRTDELIPMLEQLVADSPRLPAFRGSLLMAYTYSGQTERALAMLAAEHATGFPIRIDSGWSSGNMLWAEAAVRLHDHEAAAILHERLAPYHDQIITTAVTVGHAVAHSLGRLDHLLGRHHEANRWFAEAMAMHERLESPLLIASTNAAWADLLANRAEGDDRDRARTMAESALAAATAGGYGYIACDAAAVLQLLN